MKIIYLIVSAFFFLSSTSIAQVDSLKNWFNKDLRKDKLVGVSTQKAYDYLKGRKSKTVIVAIIDSGIDIEHEDLKENIWTNTLEIPGNNIDDDNNGYIDDIHGWNFIGNKNGKNVDSDTYEVTREYKRLLPKYKNKKKSKKADYLYWKTIKEAYLKNVKKAEEQLNFYKNLQVYTLRYNQLLTAYLEVEQLTLEQLLQIKTEDSIVQSATIFMTSLLESTGEVSIEEIKESLDSAIEHFSKKLDYAYSLTIDTRKIVGDNPTNLKEVGYGNNDVIGINTDNFHGTHVAGIIGAVRNNGIGIDGVASNVKIMAIRAVPDGDERDKDVANAIRYAVDNGAQIINMSFGKGHSPNKSYVDNAIKYAEKKHILLIHAAGNGSSNNDSVANFPTKKITKKEVATNWVEVGASGIERGNKLVASFSNYGKIDVDIFAPGVSIYSTTPDNNYEVAGGTSMASPVVAGVATVVLSYFPNLTAADLKSILMQSVQTFKGLKVINPGTEDEMVIFSDLSASGGVVNAYQAVKLAEKRSKEKSATLK